MANALKGLFGIAVVLMAMGCGRSDSDLVENRELVATLRLDDAALATTGLVREKNCFQRVKNAKKARVESVEISNQACPASGLSPASAVVVSFNLLQDTTNRSLYTLIETQKPWAVVGQLDTTRADGQSLAQLCTGTYATVCTVQTQAGTVTKINYK